MNESLDERPKSFLYVVVCAAGVAGDVGTLITMAQDRGWGVGVVATPHGLGFIDAAVVEAQTGYPIRSAWRLPGDPRPLPPSDAIAVALATFNTINKVGCRGLRHVVVGHSHVPHPPKAGGGADCFRWQEALELLGPSVDARR